MIGITNKWLRMLVKSTSGQWTLEYWYMVEQQEGRPVMAVVNVICIACRKSFRREYDKACHKCITDLVHRDQCMQVLCNVTCVTDGPEAGEG